MKLYSENNQIKIDSALLGLNHVEAGKSLVINASGHETIHNPPAGFKEEPQVIRTELFEFRSECLGAMQNPGYRVHVGTDGILTISAEPEAYQGGFTLEYQTKQTQSLPVFQKSTPIYDKKRARKKIAAKSRKRNRK